MGMHPTYDGENCENNFTNCNCTPDQYEVDNEGEDFWCSQCVEGYTWSSD